MFLNFMSQLRWRERTLGDIVDKSRIFIFFSYSVRRNNNENWLPHIMTINPEHNVFSVQFVENEFSRSSTHKKEYLKWNFFVESVLEKIIISWFLLMEWRRAHC